MCHYCCYRNRAFARSGLGSSMQSGGREIVVAKQSEISPSNAHQIISWWPEAAASPDWQVAPKYSMNGQTISRPSAQATAPSNPSMAPEAS
jgi:hypothetical protein